MAKARKVVITCAVTGAIHTPSMSPHLPITPDEIIADADGGGRSRRRGPAPARPQPGERPARSDAGGVRAFPAAPQAADRCRHQHHLGRQPDDARRGARQAGGNVQAGGRLPQYGLDQFRPLPSARPLQGVQARLGAAVPREHPRSRLPQLLQGHRIHPAHLLGKRHALRVRVLRHRPSLQSEPLPRARSRAAAALRAVGVRHPRRHRHASGGRDDDEAHRRPPVRRPIPLVGARRRLVADAHRLDGGRHGRQRPRRPRGFRCGPAPAASRNPMPCRSSSCARSWKGLGSRSRRPTRRARSWLSREPTKSASDASCSRTASPSRRSGLARCAPWNGGPE